MFTSSIYNEENEKLSKTKVTNYGRSREIVRIRKLIYLRYNGRMKVVYFRIFSRAQKLPSFCLFAVVPFWSKVFVMVYFCGFALFCSNVSDVLSSFWARGYSSRGGSYPGS